MKLHLPKQLFTALLAAITLAIPATLTLGSTAWGAESFDSIDFTGDFYPRSFSFSFLLDDVANNGSIVGAYWGGSSDNEYGANALTVTANDDGTFTVKLGRGALSNTSLDSSTTFTAKTAAEDGIEFTTTLQAGVVYTITGTDNGTTGNEHSSATITSVITGGTIGALNDEYYKNNMNGSGQKNNGVNSAYAVNASTLVWAGTGNTATLDALTDGENAVLANWKTAGSGTTATLTGASLIFDASSGIARSVDMAGEVNVASIKIYDNYSFNTTAATTLATENGIRIGSGKTLTLNSAATEVNTISGDISGGTLKIDSGSWSISGGLTSTLTLADAATLNLGDGSFISWAASELANINAKANITGTGYVKLTGTETSLGGDITVTKNYAVTGDITVNGKGYEYADLDGRTLSIGQGKSFTVGGTFSIVSRAVLDIAGGSVEADSMKLGHPTVSSNNNNSTPNWGKLTMSSGSLKTGTITFQRDKQNQISITGGTLEFTDAAAINRGSNTVSTVNIMGSSADSRVTLKAHTAWTLDGAGLAALPTIGNVTIDAANTAGITLKDVSLSDSITNNATAENTGLALENVTVSGSGITFSGAGTTTLSGTNTIAGAVTNNGSLTLSGTLDFSGATLSTESALITMGTGASLTINEGTIFKFGGLTAGTEYKFIDVSDGSTLRGWDSITAEQIYINGAQLNSSGYSITTSGGVFSFAQLISSLTWNGSANDGFWSSTSQNWTTGSASSAYVNAIDTSFTSDATATVTEAITTGNLTIGEENAQSGITVTLSAADDGSLTVANNRILSINNNSTLNSALGIEVSGATVSMGAGASWNLTDSAQQKLTETQLSAVTSMSIGANASLTVDSITTEAGSKVDASQLSGNGSLILKLNGIDNGVQFNLSNFEGGITVDHAEGQSLGLLMVNGSTFHSSTSFTLLRDGALVFNAGTEEAPTILSNNITVTNGGSASVTEIGSSVYVNSTLYSEIRGSISGAGQLFKKGGGTLTLSGNTTVSSLKAMDGTLNLGGTASLTYLGVGGGSSVADSTILNITGTVSANQLRMGEQGHAAVNIKSGGSLTISGSQNENNTSRSLLLTHWGQASTLTLDGGNLTSTGARMFLSWTGTGTFKALSGTANLLGIDFDAQGDNIKGNFYLGDESNGAGSARVNIGAAGIANVDNANVTIKLGDGTLGALSDWEMAANANNASNVQLIGTTNGTVFNTEDASTPGTGHTITINAALSGSGKLVKDGLGTLKLSGANTYTGATTVRNGILEVAASGGIASSSAVEVQKDATLKISATGNDGLLSTVTGAGTVEVTVDHTLTGSSAIGNIKVSNGALLTMGDGGGNTLDISSLQNMILNGGSVKWNAKGTSLQKLDVLASSDWTVFDMGENNDTWNSSKLVISAVSVADGATLTVNKTDNASWKQDLNIGVLTGSNTSEVIINGPGSTRDGEQYTSSLAIDSLESFQGALRISSREWTNTDGGKRDSYKAVINTGETGAKLKELSLSGFGQANEVSSATINVKGNTSVTDLRVTDSASFVISEGKKLSIVNGTVNNGTMNAGNASITSAASETPASISNVSIQNDSISAANTEEGAMGSISNALVEMQSATSFSISDMVLSNVKLSTVEGASVALNNVSGTAELDGAGSYNIGTGAAQYTLGMTPAQVGTIENDNGGTALTLSYSSNTSITMSGTDSQLWLSADPTVDANGIFGTYNLTLTLNYTLAGDLASAATVNWQELVGFTGILGDLLTAQTPEATVDLAEGEAAVAAAGTTPTVEYNYTAPQGDAQVGTLVITINGLNVPEPATSTLSLLALAALAARRRRK